MSSLKIVFYNVFAYIEEVCDVKRGYASTYPFLFKNSMHVQKIRVKEISIHKNINGGLNG